MSTPRADPDELDARHAHRAFERASHGYDERALLNAEVRRELLERLQPFKLKPAVALDLGAGTGAATRALRRSYPRALVIALDVAPGMLREARRNSRVFRRFARLCAAAAALPLATASVDLVLSNLMLQWCSDLTPPLAEVRRVLKPGGLFVLSTFGPDTLQELRDAWAQADEHSHVNRFRDLHEIGDALVHAGFVEPVLDVDRLQRNYPDTRALLRDLKAAGSHNASAGRPRSLTGRGRMHAMCAAYERQRRAGHLPASFEVLYASAWGGERRIGAALDDGEARIPVSSIGRRT